MGRPKSKQVKQLAVEAPEPDERLLDETAEYIIIVETYTSNGRSLNGLEQGYGILNKMTGVVEMRFGAYGEALQGLMMAQDHYDKFMAAYKQKMGMLN